MEYNLIVNENKYNAQVLNFEENHIILDIDGKKYDFFADRLPLNQIQISLADGNSIKSITTYISKETESKSIQINGQLYKIQDEDIIAKQGSKKKSQNDLPDNITPPMPAVVVTTYVKPGDIVEKGQKVIVLSAMKMETTLVAPFAGIVISVNASAGDKVAPGDILVEIKKENEIST